MKIEVKPEILELILEMIDPSSPPSEISFDAGYKWGLVYPTFKEWQELLELEIESNL